MGINNLNNQANFGKLTTGNIANTKGAQVNNTANKSVALNAKTLNSATLKEGVGEKFDSNNFGNNNVMYASRGPGHPGGKTGRAIHLALNLASNFVKLFGFPPAGDVIFECDYDGNPNEWADPSRGGHGGRGSNYA